MKMANQTKNRKPVSGKTKGLICLALLCALTVFVSVLGISGLRTGEMGMNVLLPWVPVSSGSWPVSLPLNRVLGGSIYTDYTVVPEDGTTIDDVIKVVKGRLNGIGETDIDVTAKDAGTMRVEVRSVDDDRLASVRSLSEMKGKFTFNDTEGKTVLNEKDVQRAVMSINNSQTAYVITLTLTDEGAQKLANAGASYLTVYLDGSQVTTAFASGNQMTMSFYVSSSNSYSTAANVIFFFNTGAVYATVTRGETGTAAASAASVRTVVLLIAAVLLAAACLYLILTGKLTGVSGIWTVWCAVLLGLFFTATLVVPSVYALNAGCLIAALLGMLLIVYTAVVRKDAIGRNIAEGQGPKQAARLGFRSAAKQVWLAHGAAIVLALILMIFSFTKSTGYTLAAFVTASAMTAVLMRAFQACFTAITNKAGLFGKAQ